MPLTISAGRAALVLLALCVAAAPFGGLRAQPTLQEAIDRLSYREIGPALMGGRISDLAVVEEKPQIFFVGAATGGVWKTENHGTTWTPLFDEQGSSSIGDVTIHQPNPNLIWVGTGEPQSRQSAGWGDGVYKSTDGGASWRHMGLARSKHIGRILIHPTDPDIVYVAALGDMWAPNEERGVFRTLDGGERWEKVLYVDEHTGAVDLAMDPGDPKTIFAAMYQRRRTGWGFNGGGPGSGLYRTFDGGDEWTELAQGLPEGDKGRIGVDVFRGDGNVVYALVEAEPRAPGRGPGRAGESKSGLFRSLDRGNSWEKLSTTNPRPMYYSQVRIDPSNSDRIYVLGTQLMVSDDGGRTFRNDGARQIHVDHHALWINPEDSDHLIIGSDGGVSASWDGTKSWRMFTNFALGQFYAVGYDMRDPYYVCGGLQDNDPWCGPSNTRSFHGIRHQDWYETAYGDGFFTIVDPTDSSIVFSETQNGNMNRYDLNTGERTPMRPIVGPRQGEDTTKAYRFNWNSPLQLSPRDPATVYLGGNYLFRSRDRGMTWEEVGGIDLTKAIDREELEIMGVKGDEPQMSRNDGISSYGTITSFAESPLEPGLLYVGTDDGNVQVSRDDGASWRNVAHAIKGAPARTYVSRVEPSAHVPGRVYVTFDGHRNGDYAAHAYASEDYGESWRSIARGLEEDSPINVIVEHHRTPGLLFVGNEVGVYVSIDRGENWTRLKGNLPVVPVDDILVHPRDNDLIVGTHGRSVWIMADVSALEGLADALESEAAVVFPQARPTVMWAERGDWPFTGASYRAPNPPRATRIRYYLRDDAARDGKEEALDSAGISIRILDSEGELVRTLEGPGRAGINEALWDWRHDPPFDAREDGRPSASFGRGGPPQGPVALPGVYSAVLEAAGERSSAALEIQADPRRPMTRADRMARQEALMELHALAAPLYDAGRAAERIEERLDLALEVVAAAEASPDSSEGSVRAQIKELRDSVAALQEEFSEVRGHASVARAISGSSTLPTADQFWRVDRAWELLPPALGRLNALISSALPELEASLYVPALRPRALEEVAPPDRGR